MRKRAIALSPPFHPTIKLDYETDCLDRDRLFLLFHSQVTATENGGAEVVSTPEPSLMLGFMTLGGFMLGSRKKAKA